LEDLHYKLLKLLESDPALTQRELSHALGISLGKVNYCLRALVEKGWIKARNFTNSHNKRAYLYLLTPEGIEQKGRITLRFLRTKVQEYERLKREIEELRREVEATGNPDQ